MTTRSCRWDEHVLHPVPRPWHWRGTLSAACWWCSTHCRGCAGKDAGAAAGHQRAAIRPVWLDLVARRRRRADRPAGGTGSRAADPPRRPRLVRPRLPADAVAPCLRLDRRSAARVLPAPAAGPATQLAWGLLSVWTGITFVGLFSPISGLLAARSAGWSGWETFWVLFYAAATWETPGSCVTGCRSLCPFARMQPLLTDPHARACCTTPAAVSRAGHPVGLGGCWAVAAACSTRPLRRTTYSALRIRCWQDRCRPSAPTAWVTAPIAQPASVPARCNWTSARDRRPIAWPVAPAWRPAHNNSSGPVSVLGWCATPQAMAGQPKRLAPRTLACCPLLLALLACGAWRLL